MDATRPESGDAREFPRLVEDTHANRNTIRQLLLRWRDSQTELLPQLQRSALLQETASLAQDVAALANAGLQALDFPEAGKGAPEAWVKEQQALLDRAAKARAELLILIVPSIRKLLEASR